MADKQEAIILLPEDAAELLGLLQIRLLKNYNLDVLKSTDHSFALALAACLLPTAVVEQAVSAKLARDLIATASRFDVIFIAHSYISDLSHASSLLPCAARKATLPIRKQCPLNGSVS